jgi:two-component system, NarL family, nitrate/nitrite sensor histidine kinase NarX
MAVIREPTEATRSRLADWIVPPATGWRRKSYGLLWGRMLRPLVALTLVLAAAIALGFLAMRMPARAPGLLLAQACLLAGGIAIGALVLVRVRDQLLEPLVHLRNWAMRMRGGNLSARLPVGPRGEFAVLARDINGLADEFKTLTLAMDAQVRSQTVRLARKTQSLDVLYDVAASLNRPGRLEAILENFLDTFIELVDARAAAVRLLTEDGQMNLIASRGLDPSVVQKDHLMDAGLCQCGWAATKGGIRVQHGTHQCTKLLGQPMLGVDCQEFVVVPVQYQDRILGVYNLFLDRPLSAMGEDVRDLLTSIGRHLGLAIEKARLDTDARRLAIMEERSMIGNELHDSLAQALVGMRLQIKMLGESLYRKDLRAAQNEVRNLRQAVDEAHSSLRELLANFRLKIDDRGLVPAVSNMVERFQQETGITVFFQNECRNLNLLPRQEIQVFYIIQEALANIRKHSHAQNVRILLNSSAENTYSVLIEDDGYGMSVPANEQSRPGEHVGLAIMRERAQRLPGEITIESELGEGTRVLLSFPTNPPAPVAARALGG